MWPPVVSTPRRGRVSISLSFSSFPSLFLFTVSLSISSTLYPPPFSSTSFSSTTRGGGGEIVVNAPSHSIARWSLACANSRALTHSRRLARIRVDEGSERKVGRRMRGKGEQAGVREHESGFAETTDAHGRRRRRRRRRRHCRRRDARRRQTLGFRLMDHFSSLDSRLDAHLPQSRRDTTPTTTTTFLHLRNFHLPLARFPSLRGPSTAANALPILRSTPCRISSRILNASTPACHPRTLRSRSSHP